MNIQLVIILENIVELSFSLQNYKLCPTISTNRYIWVNYGIRNLFSMSHFWKNLAFFYKQNHICKKTNLLQLLGLNNIEIDIIDSS